MTRRRERRVGRAAWAALAPLGGLAASRLAGYDASPLLSMANAGTPFVYLPAYGALAAGLVSGRRTLTVAAGAVVAAHAVWIAPEFRRAKPLPPGADRATRSGHAGRATRLRVVTANIRFSNADSTALGTELAALDPDVLLIQELAPHHLIMLKAAGAFEQYPYSFTDPRPRSFGSGTWSRYPLSDGDTWELPGLPSLPTSRVSVDVGGRKVALYNIHAKAPTRRYWIPRWKAQFRQLQDRVAAETGPVIMAGDFNATRGHKPFRDLLAAGLEDAHVVAGRGWAVTWPTRTRLSLPLFRLDHVLVSPHFAVLGVAEGEGPGSDHRPVIADLALLP